MAVDRIQRLYESMPARLAAARRRFGRALTLAEKIRTHTMTDEQVGWFEAGSALNALH